MQPIFVITGFTSWMKSTGGFTAEPLTVSATSAVFPATSARTLPAPSAFGVTIPVAETAAPSAENFANRVTSAVPPSASFAVTSTCV